MEHRTFSKLALMLAAFLMATPLLPVQGIPPTTLTVTGGRAEFGTFNADVVVCNVANLAGFDFMLLYDTNFLDAVGASLTGTLFDPALHNIIIGKQVVSDPLGRIRFAVSLLGDAPVTVDPSTGCASLLSVTFVTMPIGSASDYPIPITLTDDTLAVVDQGEVVSQPHTTISGMFLPPITIRTRNVGCRAQTPGFNVGPKGNLQTVFCRVANDGTEPTVGSVEFSWRSVNGQMSIMPIVVSMPLQPGESAELTAQIPVRTDIFDVFTVTADLVRLIPMPDASTLRIQGDTDVFKFNVNLPLE